MSGIALPFDVGKAADEYDALLNAQLTEEQLDALCTPKAKSLVYALAGNSPYLARSLHLAPDIMADLMLKSADALFEQEMEALEACDRSISMDQLMTHLRKSKIRVSFLIAAADIGKYWGLEDVTSALSRFADRCINLAVEHLLSQRVVQGELASWESETALNQTNNSGYFVLAMGKLGAYELNYSSDIDLIVLYDEDVVHYTGKRTLSDCMIKMTRDLVTILERRTADGYVFRTDLRLRPDPGATPLALSVGAAESYYQSTAQSWERAAMIKARVCAGDHRAGAAYLERLRPFIWRRSMDFAAIEDIHGIKNQIHRHHHHGAFKLAGFDVKLGYGGIREVEFYTQIHQLIAAGREPFLRIPQTLGALDALLEMGRISEPVRNDLAAAYRFLRQLEHRLQMVDDAQTHALPEQDDGQKRIACFAGFDSVEALTRSLKAHLDRVSTHYDQLLPDSPDGNTTLNEAQLIALLEQLGFEAPTTMAALIEGWRRGRYRSLRTARARGLLEKTLKPLLEAFSKTAQPDRSLTRFDSFLSQLPAGIQLFSLFHSNPSLFRLIARIMGIAPALAENLAKRPQLVDALLDPTFFAPLPSREELRDDLRRTLKRARDYQDVLDMVRRWTDERKFQLGVQALEAISDVRETSLSMTDLADAVLAELLPLVEADYQKRHGTFKEGALCIVSMGKFGSRELSFGSDLDLVFLYSVEEGATLSSGPKAVSPSRYYSGLGQALVTAITVLTLEGRLWEVDTRLRPSGSAGPLVVTLQTFVDYYREAAWTWEHMALTRARVTATPDDLAQKVQQAITRTLTSERDQKALLPAVAEMRQRLAQEFPVTNMEPEACAGRADGSGIHRAIFTPARRGAPSTNLHASSG
ncbi:hypothetical protein JCM17843_13270 [Kordiimonadales bacterium JCM 17843]|nr:hypothetical protein JCM17843_13270 [Kordiimonadales bacterium JCM 17843]